jgi:alkylresorcinol/alkylpyrone synthase
MNRPASAFGTEFVPRAPAGPKVPAAMAGPTILHTATAVPAHTIDQSEVKRALCEVMALPADKLAPVLALFDHALVERRASVLPLHQLVERRGLGETTRIYREHSVRLGCEVARRCLDEAAVPAAAIDLVITVSCTGIMIPSLDAHLANDLGLRPDVRRLPITELGCVAGAAALGRAHDFLIGRPDGHVLIVAVELPTLSFQHRDVSVAQLVSTALFGDGAAAALLRGADVPRAEPARAGVSILATRSHLFPDSIDALGFDLHDDGFHVVLAKDLSQRLQRDLAGVVDDVLAEAHLGRGDLTSFVLHPGGRKILSALAAALQIDRAQMQPSWDVLRENGNVSSAAVLFVLDRWMRRQRPPAQAHGLLGAFGPGLSAELCLLRWE